jgi:hypothetical protein
MRKTASLLGAATLIGSVALALSVPASARSYDKRIRIINDTDLQVSHIYTNSGSGWGDDIMLGHIDAHSARVLNFDDGSDSCVMNLRAVDHSGNYFWLKRNANVCAAEAWTLNDE